MAEKRLNESIKDEFPDVKKPMVATANGNNMVTLGNLIPVSNSTTMKPVLAATPVQLPHNGLSFEDNAKLAQADRVTSYMPLCARCNSNVGVIEDYQQGCIVCTTCGTQIGGQIIASGAEWRTFADDGTKNSADPSRVGGIDDEFEGLGTTISGTSALANRHAQVSMSSTKKALRNIVDYCKQMSVRLQLGNKILELSKEICRTVIESPEISGKGTKRNINYHSLAAVAVYEACKMAKEPRRREEILNVSDGVSNTAFNKQFTRVKEILRNSKLAPSTETTAISYIPRYVKDLSLPYYLVDPAKCIALSAKDKGFIPSSNDSAVAGAAVYFAALLIGETIPITEVGKVCITAPTTLTDLARTLYAHRKEVIPDGFVDIAVIERMSKP